MNAFLKIIRSGDGLHCLFSFTTLALSSVCIYTRYTGGTENKSFAVGICSQARQEELSVLKGLIIKGPPSFT